MIPLFLLRKLHISQRQLWSLISIFSLGAIAVAMSIARVVALAFSASTTEVALLTSLECSIAIIVACCPTLRLIFRRSGENDMNVSGLGNTYKHYRVGQGRHGTNKHENDPESSLHDEDCATDIEFRLIPGLKGQHILKHVDFEIMSERASQTATPTIRMEDWDVPQAKVRS